MSAGLAVLVERQASLPDAPDIGTLTSLIADPLELWTDDQLMLWLAREYVERIQPVAEAESDRVARLADWQLLLFLAEVLVVGATLVAALAT